MFFHHTWRSLPRLSNLGTLATSLYIQVFSFPKLINPTPLRWCRQPRDKPPGRPSVSNLSFVRRPRSSTCRAGEGLPLNPATIRPASLRLSLFSLLDPVYLEGGLEPEQDMFPLFFL